MKLMKATHKPHEVKYVRLCPDNAKDLMQRLYGQWLDGNDGFIDFRANNFWYRAEMGDYIVWTTDDVAMAIKPVQFEADYNTEFTR